MSNLSIDTTVGQLVAEQPALARVFERLGIDYCCGGKMPLAEACGKMGLDAASVLKVIRACDNGKGTDDHGHWALTTMGQLVDHIVTEHHGFLRTELPRLTGMMGKVIAAHGQREPHLKEVGQILAGFKAEIDQHLVKEEQILFPMIKELEGAKTKPAFHCGSVGNPIRVMMMEHEGAGDAMHRMRELTKNYVAPEEACNTYRALLDGLREMEEDMHRHVHEENNILFPKAAKLEAELG